MKNSPAHKDTYKELADFASRNPMDRDAVFKYFGAYEQMSNHGHDDQIKYNQLKYLYEHDQWIYLNHLAYLYLEALRASLAYMCLVESLRLNPGQKDVYELSCEVADKAQPRFPEKLMDNKVTVSVITCTNGGRVDELKESIASVLSQTFQDFELIIINDGGPEIVQEVVDSFKSSKISYFRLAESRGPECARNEAFIMAQGKYIAYLDDDDVYYPDHLEELIKIMERDDCDIAYTSTKKVDGITENGTFKELRVRGISDQEFDKNILLQYVYITTCSVMFRKEIIQKEGMFNEDLQTTSDWDFWLRYACKYRFKHVTKITCEYRKRGNNITSVNALSAAFLGNLVCVYHLFQRGKVAFIKYYLWHGMEDKARTLYEEIRSGYDGHFKVADNLAELIGLTACFGDGRFLRVLSKDYFPIDAKNCLREALKRRSIHMFLGFAPYLPLRAVKSICGRIINYAKKIKKMIEPIS